MPIDVNLVLGNADVALRGPWKGEPIVKIGPTGHDLSSGLFGYNLDFPGNALKPSCDYDRWCAPAERRHEAENLRTRRHPAAHPGQLALQYWLFYVYNDWNDKHEGDWEMIQLDFPAGTAAEALGAKPTKVGYSQHEGGESAEWGDDKLQIVDGTHPVVYPARGSHANYYCVEPLPRSQRRPGRRLRRHRRPVPGAPAGGRRSSRRRRPTTWPSFPWLGYVGKLGREAPGLLRRPDRAEHEAAVDGADHVGGRGAGATRRSRSRRGRGLSETGRPTSSAARSRRGSSVLTTLVDNPSPR